MRRLVLIVLVATVLAGCGEDPAPRQPYRPPPPQRTVSAAGTDVCPATVKLVDTWSAKFATDLTTVQQQVAAGQRPAAVRTFDTIVADARRQAADLRRQAVGSRDPDIRGALVAMSDDVRSFADSLRRPEDLVSNTYLTSTLPTSVGNLRRLCAA